MSALPLVGGKSRSGIIVMVNDIIVHWMTSRQERISLSTCEAELLAHRKGLQIGLNVRDVVQEATGQVVQMKMEGDNAGAVRSVKAGVTSWKTRHYAIDASWIREKLQEESIDLQHRPGKSLIADGMTKVLPREL